MMDAERKNTANALFMPSSNQYFRLPSARLSSDIRPPTASKLSSGLLNIPAPIKECYRIFLN
jgi:hypothetical protein